MTDRITALLALEKAVEAGRFTRQDGTARYSELHTAMFSIPIPQSTKADAMQALHNGTLGAFVANLIAKEGGE